MMRTWGHCFAHARILSFIVGSGTSLAGTTYLVPQHHQQLPHHHHHHRQHLEPIAMAVQGSAEDLLRWIDGFKNDSIESLMQGNYSSTSVVLFLVSFDKPLVSAYCNHTHTSLLQHQPPRLLCYYFPNTTWTSGRNALSRQIYRYEQFIRNKAFKYWLLVDNDLMFLNCRRPADAKGGMNHGHTLSGSGCFNPIFNYLENASTQWSIVSFLSQELKGGVVFNKSMPYTLLDCPDHQLIAIHRAIAPVVLPYVEKMEAQSWWDSAAFFNRVVRGCSSKSAAIANLFYGTDHLSYNAHAEYPRRYRISVARNFALQQVYGPYDLTPIPINNRLHGLCIHNDDEDLKLIPEDWYEKVFYATQNISMFLTDVRILPFESHFFPLNFSWVGYSGNGTGVGAIAVAAAAVPAADGEWMTTPAYKYCLRKLKPRFDAFMQGSVSVDAIDGPRLSVSDIVHLGQFYNDAKSEAFIEKEREMQKQFDEKMAEKEKIWQVKFNDLKQGKASLRS